MAVTAEPDTAGTQHDEPRKTTSRSPTAIPARAQIGIGLVALAAAVLSFSALRGLAVITGTPSEIAWLFPLTLDAAAGVSMFVWMRATVTHVIGYAKRLTWASIVVSIICNGAFHGFQSETLTPPWYVAVAVGAIAPVMFVTVVHLVFLARQPEPWGGPEAVTVTSEADGPVLVASAPDVPAEVDTTPTETAPAPEPAEIDAEPSPTVETKPLRRRCDHDGCGKLLPPGSRVGRKFCDATCRQAASRARNGSTAVTA